MKSQFDTLGLIRQALFALILSSLCHALSANSQRLWSELDFILDKKQDTPQKNNEVLEQKTFEDSVSLGQSGVKKENASPSTEEGEIITIETQHLPQHSMKTLKKRSR